MPPVNRELVNAIYQLKRRYGFKATLYFRTSSVDLTTGVNSETATPTIVRRAICLPSEWARKFAYDLSFVAANKNFTYGGFFDVNERTILIDARDLPKGFEITNDYEIVIKTMRYHMVKVEHVDEDRLWILQVKSTRGELPKQVIDLAATDRLEASDECSQS